MSSTNGPAIVRDTLLRLLAFTSRRAALGCSALALVLSISAEPIVLTGSMVPSLIGAPISGLRLTNEEGQPIPFQIDEVTPDGEYVCDRGTEPNAFEGNGVLDSSDEIVFLFEDASPVQGAAPTPERTVEVRLCRKNETRRVLITPGSPGHSSTPAYIFYDNVNEIVRTPYYYAQFGHDRFHFTRAGITLPGRAGYVGVTRELRVRIHLRALGVVPIEYDQDNMVCIVRRYKVGPIRLIRRGDFHLNLGLWVKGSRAAVNQICYPQMVGVPVNVHLPVRFRTLFNEAYIEMAPVMVPPSAGYVLDVPRYRFVVPLTSGGRLDTLLRVSPNHEFFSVHDAQGGFGWLLGISAEEKYLEGSGFLARVRSDRRGGAQCGYRLTVRDLPRGRYLITNWVVFSHEGVAGLSRAGARISSPVAVRVDGRDAGVNALARVRILER